MPRMIDYREEFRIAGRKHKRGGQIFRFPLYPSGEEERIEVRIERKSVFVELPGGILEGGGTGSNLVMEIEFSWKSRLSRDRNK